MSRELLNDAHEELVEEYLDEHPEADWQTAYDATADAAYERMCDNIAAIGDAARDRAKYGDA